MSIMNSSTSSARAEEEEEALDIDDGVAGEDVEEEKSESFTAKAFVLNENDAEVDAAEDDSMDDMTEDWDAEADGS